MRRRSSVLIACFVPLACCMLLPACLRGGFTPDAASDVLQAGELGHDDVADASAADTRATDVALDDAGEDGGRDASPWQYLYLEAESGTLIAPFALRDDPQASGGRYLIDDEGTTGKRTAGEARYTVTVRATGTFFLWGRCRAPATDVDSFFVAVDGQQAIDYHTSTRGLSDAWTWTVVARLDGDPVTPIPFVLSAGDHTIVLSSRESGSKIDRLLLTDDLTFTP